MSMCGGGGKEKGCCWGRGEGDRRGGEREGGG